MAMKPSLTLLLTLESLELPIEALVKWFRTALLLSGLAVLLLSSSFSVSAQARKPQPDITIDSAVRTEVIESVIKQLNEQYVFPETAKEIEKALRERVQRKEYDRITSAAELAKTLTTLLLEVSRDQH